MEKRLPLMEQPLAMVLLHIKLPPSVDWRNFYGSLTFVFEYHCDGVMALRSEEYELRFKRLDHCIQWA